MVLALFVITAIAATVLGFVYESTKAPIADAKLNKKLNAIKLVVPAFTNNPSDEQYELAVDGGEPLIVYPAKDKDELVGVAIETYTMKGFSGLIKLMVGFTPDGSIYNYQVLEHKETPGLGTHMDHWFKPEAVVEGAKPKTRNKFVDGLFGINAEAGGQDNIVTGKNPGSMNLTVKQDGGDVDAITAATISSRAFCDAIQRAYDAYMKEQGGNHE